MKACLRLALLILAFGFGLLGRAHADSPPPGWDRVAGKWEGVILIWKGNHYTLMPAVMRIRHIAFDSLDLPLMGCENRIKQVENPPAPWGAGPIYMVDSEDGMCGIVTVSVRIRGERAEVLADNGGTVQPIGVLFQHWNGRELLEEYRASYRSSAGDTARWAITDLVRSMTWKPVIPDEAYAHLAAGHAALSEGANELSFKAAERHFLDALKLAPWWADAQYNLALVYEAQGRSGEALRMFVDYLGASGFQGAAGAPSYGDFKKIFQVEVTEPAAAHEKYGGWARDVAAYMKAIAKQEAALARARADYSDEVEDFIGDGCSANTSSDSLWRKCHARHLEHIEWSEHLNQMAADVAKANAMVEEWLDEGFRAYNAGEYDKARNVIQPLAEGGDKNALYLLGRMYRYGQGVPQSKSDAVRWLKKAVANGSKKGQKELDGLSNE